MSFNTYGELKVSVATWLNRKDLTDNIPDFISLAETRIFRFLRSPSNEVGTDYMPALDDTSIVIPNDLLELKLLVINGETYKFISYDYLIQNKLALADTRVFSRIQNNFIFPFSFKGTEQVTMIYWQDQSGFNEDSDFSATLRTAPDLYLFGALLEAEPFIKDDERIPIWNAKYDKALEEFLRYNRTLDYGASVPEVSSGGF